MFNRLDRFSTYQFLQIAKAVGDEEVVECLLGGLGAGVAGGLDHPDLDPLVLLGVRLLGGFVGRLSVPLEVGRWPGSASACSGMLLATASAPREASLMAVLAAFLATRLLAPEWAPRP